MVEASRGKGKRWPTLVFEGEAERLPGDQLELVMRAGGCCVSTCGRAVELGAVNSKQEVAASVSREETERSRT
jgi:hypothetical protein